MGLARAGESKFGANDFHQKVMRERAQTKPSDDEVSVEGDKCTHGPRRESKDGGREVTASRQ